jgi:hypothetical protein
VARASKSLETPALEFLYDDNLVTKLL